MKYEIKQAVILAGGMGTRLKPITDKIPKPMVVFHGKPFLQYLVEQLKEQGFTKILMLLGYLPDKIMDYFDDGKKFGIKIEYSVSDINNDTGKRIKLVKDKLDSHFLLMYCDNYCPVNFNDMWKQYEEKKVLAQVTLYANKDCYTKNNIFVDEFSMVKIYDKSRTSNKLNSVDIGYVILNKKVIDLIPNENVNFEKVVYPILVEERQIAAFKTEHRYYSVGSIERLKITEEFLKNRPAIILDRDGVLNVKSPKACYVTSYDEFRWIYGSIEAIRLLKKAGYLIIIVTNQAGIARGIMTEEDLVLIHEKMKKELKKNDGDVDAIYFCPHGWNDGCECRKPKPGMLFEAQKNFNIDLSKTYFIGDDERDLQAAKAANCKYIMVSNEYKLIDIVKNIILK